MKKYDNYKDSGIEWLGEIPEHWNKSSLKWYSEIYSGGTPSKDIEEYWINGTIPWLNSGSVNQGDITEVSEYITEEALNKSSAKWIPENSLVMALAGQGKTKGMVAQVKFKTTCNQSLGIIVPNNKINNRFLLYWLRTNYQNIRNLGGGDKRDGLNLVMLGGIPIPIPKTEEQTTIANYLDHKTTQIDTLISKKEQFISLLQEERTAVINQAVTKGLDPNLKMKDSGIEWLGEIPEHWEVKRLRNLVETIKTGSTPPSEEIQYFEPREINWYGPGDFDNLILGNSKRKISKLAIDENKCRLFPANSILLIGIGATVGKVGLVLEDCSSNQQINAIVLKDEYHPMYYLYFLSTIKDIIVMEASSATLPIFNQTQTKNIIIPVPPTKEQIEISDFIRGQEIRIETIISKSQQEIELLKEYKTALISEVVTGKVDVRNENLN